MKSVETFEYPILHQNSLLKIMYLPKNSNYEEIRGAFEKFGFDKIKKIWFFLIYIGPKYELHRNVSNRIVDSILRVCQRQRSMVAFETKVEMANSDFSPFALETGLTLQPDRDIFILPRSGMTGNILEWK